MTRTRTAAVLLLTAALTIARGAVCPTRAAAPERRTLTSAQAKSLRHKIAGYAARVAENKATRATANALEKIVEQAPLTLAAEAAAVLAHYHRARNELELALKTLAPWVPPGVGPAHKYPKASLEQVRCLYAQGKLIEAIPILQWIAEQCPDPTQIEAAKFAGDLCCELSQFERAVSFYEWALKLVALHYPYADPNGADKRWRALLKQLIAETKRRWDIERYGADFVAYRDADRLRFANKPAQALARYDEVIKTYPGTVYSEAATVYSGYCHRELEDYAKAEKLWRDQLKNPWGLYRGEICLALANMEFECRLRPEDAEYWYKKAIEWMDKVGLVDSRISVFNVPGQAIGISAPPMRMKEQKAWFGPPDWSKVKPGTIINRRTCHWYLNKLRLDAHGKLALIKFLGGDAKGAQDEIGAILKYDEYERAQHDKKLPNSYRRLHYEFGRGSLRAKPEEFAAFQGRAKCLIAIADYYYEIEDWGRAEAACNRMALLHRAGKLALSNSAQAYLAYSRGMLRYVQFDFDRAAKIFRGFDSAFRRTSSWDRAKFAHRQILMQTEGCEAAVRVLKQIVRERPGTESERLAWYLIGEQYYCFDRLDASEKAFRFYLKKYPDRPEAAQSYLESIEKQRKDARQS